MIELLSRTMRQLDLAPARIEPDPRILQQAQQRKTPETLLRYLHHGMTIAIKWYQQRLKDAPPALAELWHELMTLQERNQKEVARALPKR
jgi:hypothetical protein